MGFGFGGLINSITGASNSAKQSAKYSTGLQAQNNAFQKEIAQNAHQWEVEDLKKAGLNPVLSTGGTGASAGGFGGGGTVAMQSGIGGLSDIMNSAAGLMKLSSELENLEAEKELKRGQIDKIGPEIQKINTETSENIAKTKELVSRKLLNMSAKAFNERRASGKGGSISTHGIKINF